MMAETMALPARGDKGFRNRDAVDPDRPYPLVSTRESSSRTAAPTLFAAHTRA